MGALISRSLSSTGVEHGLSCKSTKEVRQQLATKVFAAVGTWFAQGLVPTLSACAVYLCVLK